MKALELAVKQEVYIGGTLGSETASELRRLAEVNAELLEALERAQTTLRNYPAWEGQVDEIARNIAKAKEQQ